MPGSLEYRFHARYAGVDLAVEAWQIDRSRSLIVHLAARGQGAQLSDRGRVPRTDSLTVRLVGDAAQVTGDRDTLIEIDNSGQARRFEHPIDGQWLARLSEFNESVDSNGPVFTMTLTEDRAAETRTRAALQEDSGTQQKVEAATLLYEEQRRELAEGFPVLADSLIAGDALLTPIDNWEEASATHIDLDLDASRAQIEGSLGSLDGLLDPAAHETAMALLQASAAIEQYATSVRRYAVRLANIEVPTDKPLIRILTELYGARRSRELLDDVIKSNSVADPMRIRAGTVLQLPPL